MSALASRPTKPTLCRAGRPFLIMDRARGEYLRPEEDLEEYRASFAGATFHEVHAVAVGLSEQLDSKV